MAKFGLQLLDTMNIANEHGDFDVKKGTVTVNLIVTDPSPWQPTKPNDKKWNEANKEMILVNLCCIILCVNPSFIFKMDLTQA